MTRARRSSPPVPGRMSRLAATMVAHPMATGGGLLMLAMAVAIVTNALALQSGPHPAPLFLGTRPASPDEMAAGATPQAQQAADEIGSIEDLVARTAGRPRTAVDGGLVTEIQEELKARGYYVGDV
ncbi:MAG TPA: hypothetical protein VMP03_04030, partial [Methylomirabilota bacterium]|nr:hypothetical protein [Methylomirabilota bacterium]